MICRPIFWASITISMYSSSLKPLQMIGVSLSAIAITASSSGFEPASRPNWYGLPNSKHFFHHLALLVHLDRIHAANRCPGSCARDRVGERLVHLAQPVLQNFAEANQNRRRDAAQHQRVDQLLQIDATRGVLCRVHPQVSVLADREIALAPAGDIVEIGRVGDRPAIGRFPGGGALVEFRDHFAL